MPKFCANLSMIFTEVPFLERFAAAADAGFKGVEYLFPYDYPAESLASLLKVNRLAQVLFNLPAGDWAAGERGIACLPDRVAEFREGVGRAIDYALALGCTRVNCLAGKCPPGLATTEAEATLIANLKFAAAELEKAEVRLMLEAVNTYDIPGFFVPTTSRAIALMDAVGSSNLFYQYDIYHMQRMEGELAATIHRHLARIGHMQLADNPGRHEPGSGEINYAFLLPYIDDLGYDGWIGCEYAAAGATVEGLGWMKSA